MDSKSAYGDREVEANKSVLVELLHILGELKDAIVVIGGSVLPLLWLEIRMKSLRGIFG